MLQRRSSTAAAQQYGASFHNVMNQHRAAELVLKHLHRRRC
jgi:hypothetical protein